VNLRAPHGWDLDYAGARAAQEELAGRVSLRNAVGPPRIVTGVDVAFDKQKRRALAVAVSFRFPELELSEVSSGEAPLLFPYIPGLLTFREGPAILHALSGLERAPDLLIFDGQGIAHPRGLGLAAHLGVITGVPAIGAAKSRYVGEHEEVGRERGEWAPLKLRRRTVGCVLRTRTGVRPLYVSPGHLVSVRRARVRVLECCTGYRLPEPTRQADRIVGEWKRSGRRP
jgi:deoxyribonuclease V